MSSITSVQIPASVETLGNNLFYKSSLVIRTAEPTDAVTILNGII